MKQVRYCIIFLALCLFSEKSLYANVKLSALFSDHMVIQRNQPFKVWGTADAREKIQVIFHDSKLSTKTDSKGNWQILLPPYDFGGPFEMVISGKNTITIVDILIGDVWVCSGQSNMQFEVGELKDPEKEIAAANYPSIRLFNVPYSLSGRPLKTINNSYWNICNSENIKRFSAVAYFFGRHLNTELNVPIGLIESTVGGSSIKTWSSEASLSKFPRFQKPFEELRTKNFVEINEVTKRLGEAWYDTIHNYEPGIVGKWHLPTTENTVWQKLNVPYPSDSIQGFGAGWFRKEFELTEKEASANLVIFLGLIQNKDETYLNGVKIGELSRFDLPRIYGACNGMLRAGKNVLIVKAVNNWGSFGFNGQAEDMYCQTAARKIPLSGDWQFKVGRMSTKPYFSIGHNDYPSLLYNAMLSPLTSYSIKGVVWYQGEQDAHMPLEYASLLPNMIEDWRKHWSIGNFPFLIVQLPNYMDVKAEPAQSNWAEFREAQAKALKLPETGIAVTIDLGEAEDIHPKNKLDVGNRLALVALKQVYHKNIISSGPVFKSMEIIGEKVVLDFTETAKGLTSNDRYDYVKGFAIAGSDQKFYWARAFIKNNQVHVYCDKVTKPVAIRYAWADNPEDANLRNSEGLPAAPFRSDNWSN